MQPGRARHGSLSLFLSRRGLTASTGAEKAKATTYSKVYTQSTTTTTHMTEIYVGLLFGICVLLDLLHVLTRRGLFCADLFPSVYTHHPERGGDQPIKSPCYA